VSCCKSLGDACERFMYDRFQEKVEMPTEKAIDTLLRLDIVREMPISGRVESDKVKWATNCKNSVHSSLRWFMLELSNQVHYLHATNLWTAPEASTPAAAVASTVEDCWGGVREPEVVPEHVAAAAARAARSCRGWWMFSHTAYCSSRRMTPARVPGSVPGASLSRGCKVFHDHEPSAGGFLAETIVSTVGAQVVEQGGGGCADDADDDGYAVRAEAAAAAAATAGAAETATEADAGRGRLASGALGMAESAVSAGTRGASPWRQADPHGSRQGE
ncbi:hypothetical protein Taro_042349, partial [Colocasia esculenta]|nr:hypothetical protein [Colocasia esculenta]